MTLGDRELVQSLASEIKLVYDYASIQVVDITELVVSTNGDYVQVVTISIVIVVGSIVFCPD